MVVTLPDHKVVNVLYRGAWLLEFFPSAMIHIVIVEFRAIWLIWADGYALMLKGNNDVHSTLWTLSTTVRTNNIFHLAVFSAREGREGSRPDH